MPCSELGQQSVTEVTIRRTRSLDPPGTVLRRGYMFYITSHIVPRRRLRSGQMSDLCYEQKADNGAVPSKSELLGCRESSVLEH